MCVSWTGAWSLPKAKMLPGLSPCGKPCACVSLRSTRTVLPTMSTTVKNPSLLFMACPDHPLVLPMSLVCLLRRSPDAASYSRHSFLSKFVSPKTLLIARLVLTNWLFCAAQLQVYRGTLFERMKELIAAELCVTVNTDDPPFFGGYMNENYQFWVDNVGITEAQILQLGLNSFEAAFMPESEKSRLQQEVQRCSGLQKH